MDLAIPLGSGLNLRSVVSYVGVLVHIHLHTTFDFLRGILLSSFEPVAFRFAPVFWKNSCIAFLVGVLLVSSLGLLMPLDRLVLDCFSDKPGILK